MESRKIKEEFGFQSEAEAVKEYDALNRDFMHANYPLIADEIISRMNLSGVSVLDIGTGTGALACEFARRLPSSKIYGIDISQEMLDTARDSAQRRAIDNVEFLYCDAQKMSFEDARFDLIVSFGVLHHLSDVELAFAEIKRTLKPGGSAYIYDLRKDAPQEVVSEIASGMSSSQSRAFLESVKEALDLKTLENILGNLDLAEYSLSYPKFSRRTIAKNIKTLKKSKFSGERFNRILVEIFLRK